MKRYESGWAVGSIRACQIQSLNAVDITAFTIFPGYHELPSDELFITNQTKNFFAWARKLAEQVFVTIFTDRDSGQRKRVLSWWKIGIVAAENSSISCYSVSPACLHPIFHRTQLLCFPLGGMLDQ